MHFSAQRRLLLENSVCPSVRPLQLSRSMHCENGEREVYGEPCYYWATQGTHLQPVRPPLPPNWGSHPPVKTCIANCGQTVPDTTVVCIDSLWEHTITLSDSAIVNPRAPLSQKRGSQQIKLKNAKGCRGKLTLLHPLLPYGYSYKASCARAC